MFWQHQGLSSQLRRNATSVILLTVIFWLSVATASTQSPRFKRHFISAEKPQINITNAAKISVDVWLKDEIWVAAESNSGTVTDDDIDIIYEIGKVDLECRPTSPGKEISLSLLIPPWATLDLSGPGSQLRLVKFNTAVTVDLRGDKVNVSTFGGVELDFRKVEQAVVNERPAGKPAVNYSVAHRKVGTGPPFLIFEGTTLPVAVEAFPALDPVSPLTAELLVTAQHKGPMSQALLTSHPRLAEIVRIWDATDLGQRESSAAGFSTSPVNLSISVTDKRGKPVTGLKQADFTVYEDDVLQPISHFSQEAAPFNLMVIVGMTALNEANGDYDLITASLRDLQKKMRPQDRMGIIVPAWAIRVFSHLTNDRKGLSQILEDMSAGNGFILYDALGYALAGEFNQVQGERNAVVVLSAKSGSVVFIDHSGLIAPQVRYESMPSNSFLKFEPVLQAVKEADIRVYTIWAGDDNLPAQGEYILGDDLGRGIQRGSIEPRTFLSEGSRSQMQTLAEASGGSFYNIVYNVGKRSNLEHIFGQITDDLKATYSVAYNPVNQVFDGKFRKIRVQVNRPDVIVRTRQGYYATK